MSDYSDQLTEIRAAISAIMDGGQEYTIGGRRFRRADLAVLQAMQRELEGKVGNEKYGTRAYADWPGR